MSESEEKIQFKPIKRKNIRQRKSSQSDEESPANEDKAKLDLIYETREKQKLRTRQSGVNV